MTTALIYLLRRYLLKKVTKKWHDYPRTHLHYVRQVAEGGKALCNYTSDFDRNGIV